MADAVTGGTREARRSIPSLARPSRKQPNRTIMPSQRHPMPERPVVKDSGLWERVSSALVYAALLVYLMYPYADYDWGWHYRYGEYFFTHGRILRHDIFSWTMTGYEWVNHSWLYDPLLYFLYNHISFVGLSLAGAVTGLVTFHLCVRRAPLVYWQKAVLAVFFAALSREALLQGLRSQVVGLLLFAILVDLLFREREGRTWSYGALPCLFWIWVNLHGSFLLGLLVFGVHVASDFVVRKIRRTELPRRWFVFAGSFLASVALTFVNPFTYHVYLEALRHFGNPLLTNIVEWQRPDFSEIVGLLFLSYTLLVAFAFLVQRKLANLPWLVVATLTFYLAVTARRHVPVFMVLTLPLVALVVKDMRFRVEGVARTSLVFVVMMAIFGTAVFERRAEFPGLWRTSMRTYCSYGPRCSEGLMQFLIRRPPVGHGFNYYDWGGYLIGMGVKTQVFIDGRMTVWERGDYHPMADYNAMYNRHDLDTFIRHHFDWVIVPRNSNLAKELTAYRSPSSGPLESDLWEVAYRDDVALYLVRKRARTGA
jgi:hypothetical protein